MPVVKKIKKKNIKHVSRMSDNSGIMSGASNPPPNFLREMRVEDLLDLEFFEKCFFGKKLTLKDQLIFRIYARELLELIKSNINR